MLGYLILTSFILRFFFSVFPLVVVSIEKIYQTTEKVFHHNCLEVGQKYSAACRLITSVSPRYLEMW